MGGLKGGLAIATLSTSAIIAAMTGLTGTGVLTMGLVAYPEMIKRGYNKRLSAGCVTVGGALGPIIPPSVPMILVAGFSDLSVGKLFIAGFIPGILMAIFFIVYLSIRCFINSGLGPPIPKEERATWKEKITLLGGTILPILLILLVLGGIYTGAFTPTEAGGIGAAGAMVCAGIYGNLNFKNFLTSIMTTFRTTGTVMWLVLGGATFSSLFGITGIAHSVQDILTTVAISPLGILILMLAIIFIMGMFIETLAIFMICLPIMMPVAISLGFDPLWFAFIFMTSVIIGVITPPFGYNIFYFKGLDHKDISMKDVFIGTMYYIPLMLLVVVLCIIFPELVTWLPNTMIR
jgi:tripartite ATP-independent transporter DctM subunit